MRRLVLYAVAIMIGGFTAVLAWAWPEARLAFITLGGGVVGALWWGARLPETKRVDLQGAAAVTMVVGLAMAIVFPSPLRIPRRIQLQLSGRSAHRASRCDRVAGAIGAALLVGLANRRRSRRVERT
jgi:hypothetical protein